MSCAITSDMCLPLSTRSRHHPHAENVPVIRPLFQSSSAPTLTETLVLAMSRPYTRRADSVTDDHDATVRREKRSLEDDTPVPGPSTKPAADSRKQISRNTLSPFS